MSDRLNAEAVFLEHLATIERAAAKAARRYGLWGDDAEDFAEWVKVKLIENDYAALRKFRGESDWKTFLVTVISRLGSADSRERRGRWRPSAEAERRGPPAPALERLVRRDGYRLDQAGEQLRTSGQTTLSDAELARLLAALPERGPLRPVQVPAEPVLETAQGSSRADAVVTDSERAEWRNSVLAALDRAMEQMEPDDRIIVRMRFADGYTLADVARALGIEQKPLYRRLPKLKEILHGYLVAEGISADVVRALLDSEAQ
jgi:RNA polymerase sigma factor (sigma-70 family)